MRTRAILPVVALALALAAAGAPGAAPRLTAAEAPRGGVLAIVRPPALRDAISMADRQLMRAAASLQSAGAPEVDVGALQRYSFYPQGGLAGRDLFFYNFTDLDTATTGIRDWDCSGYTYDGHHGHDSGPRGFREQAIGVPIFAVLDGTVTTAHDGEFDEMTEWVNGTRANFVVVDHGGGHRTYYYHLKQGSVAVAAGDTVKAGQQIGLTGSSGISTGPHLHFESHQGLDWYEPSAGPCRPGASQWLAQPPVARDLVVADFYLTDQPIPCCTWPELAHDLDPALRKASFPLGPRRVYARADLHNVPGGSTFRVRVRPVRGAPLFDFAGSFGYPDLARLAIPLFWFDLPGAAGTWRFVLEVNGTTVVDAPLAATRRPLNRAPNPVRLSLAPAPPRAGAVTVCRVETSLVHEDPDYDLVRYHYEWRAGKRLLRAVTSAALSDALPREAARPGEVLFCRVVPSDGRVNGRVAVARATVKP